MNDKIAGAVYGFAYGDSWGRIPEFQTHVQISEEHPDYPQKAAITDDTQMSLYTIYGIMYELENARSSLLDLQNHSASRAYVRKSFADSYVEWLEDPDNNRAPGLTCLRALEAYRNAKSSDMRLEQRITGNEGCDWNSKGCGANMRVGWLGLLPLPESDIINLAVLQSETTHGHPLALASSVITALTAKALYRDEITLSDNLLSWAEKRTRELLDDLLLRSDDAPASWSVNYREGLAQLTQVLEEAQTRYLAFALAGTDTNICSFFGGGWVAEEAYILALAAVQLQHAEPVEAVRRLVYSSGDSDSIAAIGGMFLGASKGQQIFPEDWVNRFEPRYEEELSTTVQFLNRLT
jgi:ADP-ribosylglycohydrolase